VRTAPAGWQAAGRRCRQAEEAKIARSPKPPSGGAKPPAGGRSKPPARAAGTIKPPASRAGAPKRPAAEATPSRAKPAAGKRPAAPRGEAAAPKRARPAGTAPAKRPPARAASPRAAPATGKRPAAPRAEAAAPKRARPAGTAPAKRPPAKAASPRAKPTDGTRPASPRSAAAAPKRSRPAGAAAPKRLGTKAAAPRTKPAAKPKTGRTAAPKTVIRRIAKPDEAHPPEAYRPGRISKQAVTAGPAAAPHSRKRPAPVAPDRLELLVDAARGSLEDDKAEDIQVLDVAGRADFTDRMIIATGQVERQLLAMATHVEDALGKLGMKLRRSDIQASPDWVLIDCGDLVIHLFRPEAREIYALERMWGPGSPGPEG